MTTKDERKEEKEGKKKKFPKKNEKETAKEPKGSKFPFQEGKGKSEARRKGMLEKGAATE